MTTNFLSAVFRPLARSARRAFVRRLALAALAAAPLTLPVSAMAQAQMPTATATPAPSKTYWKSNVFSMPVSMDNSARSSLREVQLYVKEHPAKAWTLKDTAPPTATGFSFRPPQDGEYWFTVVTVDKLGRATPPDLNAPGIGVVVVVVDTQPPQVSLRPQPRLSDGQIVECVVCDANPDPGRTRFEYQTGDKNWRTAETVPGFPDAYLIPVQAVTTGLARATVMDRAGNATVREINLNNAAATLVPDVAKQTNPTSPQGIVGVKSNSAPVSPGLPLAQPGPLSQQVMCPATPQPLEQATSPTIQGNAANSNSGIVQLIPQAPKVGGVIQAQHTEQVSTKHAPLPAPAPGAPAGRHLINQTHVSLEYQVDEVGPSGIGKVEVYVTSDQGQSWQRLCEDADHKSPVELDLAGEGLFGITLVASNGRNYGGSPPRPGEAPDWWIEVDLTRPVVELTSVQPTDDAKAMMIQWKASDKNLADGPVDLYYAINRDGPWTAIARGVKNDGRYHWNVPALAPQAYVRVIVSDRAGNVCQCETANPVVLDQSRPHAHVINMAVTPSGN